MSFVTLGLEPKTDNKSHIVKIGVILTLRRFIDFSCTTQWSEIAPSIQHEALRASVNAMGCMVGGALHPMTHHAHAALGKFAGTGQAYIVTAAQADPLHAALINGLAGAAYSFDDTFSQALLHPVGPVFAACWAAASTQVVDGPHFLRALVMGVELACRLSAAVAVAPAEADVGWSQTGIACGAGAALAGGLLLNVTADQAEHAVGIALAEAAGTRAMHGSMTASLIFGRAAQSGLRAAYLAQAGFTATPGAFDGRFGFCNSFAKVANPEIIAQDLGQRYLMAENRYKPYPCGLVIYPALDLALECYHQHGIRHEEIESCRFSVAAAAVKLGDHPNPQTDIAAKVSLQHWVAAALMTGTAGLGQGGQAMVDHPDIKRIRAKISLDVDPKLNIEQAKLQITLRDGRVFDLSVQACTGSLTRPMSDDNLGVKFLALAEPALGAETSSALLDALWDLTKADDVAPVLRPQAMTHH